MSIRLHACAYKYSAPAFVVSDELETEFYRLSHSSIDDFDPSDEELNALLSQLAEGGNEEAAQLSRYLESQCRNADFAQFERW